MVEEFLGTVSPSILPAVPVQCLGSSPGMRMQEAWRLGRSLTHALSLPADDCLWGFPAQGLVLPELLQHLGPAGGQRVPHLLWHPVSPSTQDVGTQLGAGVKEVSPAPEGLLAGLSQCDCDWNGVGPQIASTQCLF